LLNDFYAARTGIVRGPIGSQHKSNEHEMVRDRMPRSPELAAPPIMPVVPGAISRSAISSGFPRLPICSKHIHEFFVTYVSDTRRESIQQLRNNRSHRPAP
jgi:hypothetical protein